MGILDEISTAINIGISIIIVLAILGGVVSWINPFDITGANADRDEIEKLDIRYGKWINESASLIDQCKFKSDMPKIKGKVLVCDYPSKKVSDIHMKISPILRIKSKEEIYPSDSYITLIFVNEFESVVARYTDYTTAIQEGAYIYLIDNSMGMSPIGYFNIYGSRPPSTKTSGSTGRGSDVTPNVIRWIDNLQMIS